jgi:hypothetical protein
MQGEAIIYIEIPVKITFEYDAGEEQTKDCPESLPDIRWMNVTSFSGKCF